MVALRTEIAAETPATRVPHAPTSEIPKSDVQEALAWLAAQIAAATASLTALIVIAQYAADEARSAATRATGALLSLRDRIGHAQTTADAARNLALLSQTLPQPRRAGDAQTALSAQVFN